MNTFSYARKLRYEYETQTIPLFGGYDYSQCDTINKIDHYSIDSYTEDDAYDDIIGAYPFDNISKYRVLLEARATDFDQKHFEVPPTNSSRKARISSMVATKALTAHMEDIKFAKLLNDLCSTRAKYGGVVLTKEGENIVVEKWQQLITDQADIMSAPRLKRLYMTPSEMMKITGWSNTKDAIMTAQEFRSQDIGDEGSEDDADSTGSVIEVFILEGDLTVSMLKSAQALRDNVEYEWLEDDDFEFQYARIIFCGADWTEENTEGKLEEHGIILYAAKEAMPLQKYLARNPIAGRGLGEGLVESLFEHQKWHNFTKTEEMRMIAIAGKKLYVTDDPDILANIFDEGVDHGTVLRVSQGKSLTELNQLPTGVPIYQSIRQEWDDSASKSTSSFSAAIGEEAKSGTPFRSQYLQNIEAHSQFEQYREEIGIFLKEVIEDWVLPDALKKAASKDEIFDTFSPQELQLIDEVIIESAMLQSNVEQLLAGKMVDPLENEMMRQDFGLQLKKEGSKRQITDIKEFIKDAGKHVRVHTTDEARSKAVLFESYANLLGLLSPEDPRFNALMDKVMQALGITREELELYSTQAIQGQNTKMKTEELMAAEQPRAQAAMSKV
jgi:hypothetical protein